VLAWVLAVPAAVAAGLTLGRGSLAAGVAGAPLADTRIDTGGVGLAVRRIPQSGQGPHADGEEALVASVVSDLQTFWASAVPRIAHRDFTPLRGGVTAMDSAASDGSGPCVSSPGQIVGNAYYCPSDDGIVYDSSALVPVLLSRYGVAGLVGAFAHEFGHAVQARIGPTPEQRTADPARYPSLLIEAQGDCDAGAFLAWVIAGKAPHIHFGDSALLDAVGPLLDFADPVQVSRTDSTAHGLSLDRLTAVLLGYRQGAAACHAMTADSLHPTLGAVPLPAGGAAALAKPRYASTEAVVAAAQASIRAFTGSPVTAEPAAADLAAAAPYGQFAQATVLALAEGRTLGPAGLAELARPTGLTGLTGLTGPGATPDATFASCFAGAWTASVFGTSTAGSLGSWPGDADEALAAVRIARGATFADAAGYADGFHRGLVACR